MDFIQISCGNGHKLKAAVRLCGTTVACPKCKLDVSIPLQSQPAPRKTLTETGMMRVLTEGDLATAQPVPMQAILSAQRRKEKTCTRCKAIISDNSVVCQKCQCYVGKNASFMDSMNYLIGVSKAHVR